MMSTTTFSRTVVHYLFEMDEPFRRSRRDGLDQSISANLQRFWEKTEFRELCALLDIRSHQTWDDIVPFWTDLSAGKRNVLPSYEAWIDVAVKSREESDPMTAAILSLYAMAGWEGVIGRLLFHNHSVGHETGWHIFPLVVAGNLLNAGAFWSARSLADVACAVIESADYLFFIPETQASLARYHDLCRSISEQSAADTANLRWELQQFCRDREPNLRAEVAALFWTLGDVPHAMMLRTHGTPDVVPTDSVLTELIDASHRFMLDDIASEMIETPYRRLLRDPLVTSVWKRILERGNLDPRSTDFLLPAIEGESCVSALAPVMDGPDGDIADVYAEAAIGYFAGRGTPAALERLARFLGRNMEFLEYQAPMSFVRLGALVNLTDNAPDELKCLRWTFLATLSVRTLHIARHLGKRERMDMRLDIPFHHLSGSAPDDLAARIQMLEQFRAAGLRFWLRITPPDRTGVPEDLAAEEDALLELYRGAHIILLPKPISFEYVTLMGPESRPDPDQAHHDLDDVEQSLHALWKRIAEVAPHYAAKRSGPEADLREFSAALAAAQRCQPC